MSNEVFYGSNKKIRINSTIEDAEGEYKTTTRDGYKVYHWTYYDNQRRQHISYDTVLIDGEHEYIYGSGHQTDARTGHISQWDWGNQQTWKER